MTSPISALSPYTAMVAGTTAPTGTAATTGTAGTGTPGATSGSAAGQSMLDPQAFLQLLVAQLQYQDPSNPVDTSTFMQQTAMLSQTQSITQMQQTMTTLLSAQQTQAATELIGKTVTWLDATGVQQSGTVDSAALLASGPSLSVGSTSIPLSAVVGVSAPQPAGSSATTGTTSPTAPIA